MPKKVTVYGSKTRELLTARENCRKYFRAMSNKDLEGCTRAVFDIPKKNQFTRYQQMSALTIVLFKFWMVLKSEEDPKTGDIKEVYQEMLRRKKEAAKLEETLTEEP